MLHLAASAPCRCPPLSSNVRRRGATAAKRESTSIEAIVRELWLPAARGEYDALSIHWLTHGGHISASYELKKNDKGQYSFVLKAENAETILRSELYESKASAQNGIASVQKNCPTDANYERTTASDGRFYFNLKSTNRQVIGTSQMYASAASRDSGIESVKTNGATTIVNDA